MATAPVSKVEMHKLVIDGTNLSPNPIEIQDGDLVEFHVVNFQGKKHCKLTISSIDYTDVGTTTLSAVGTSSGPDRMGTIKIGS